MTDVSAKAVGASAEVLSYRDAYERVRDEVAAVPDERLTHINIDIPSAVTTVLGSLAEIRTFRGRLSEELPKFDIARFDKLETYTRALYHVHALFMAASMPPESVQELAQECSAVVATFRRDAEALTHRGLIESSLVRNLRNSTGYKDIAFDLYLLTQVLRENWAKIEGKTALQLAEVGQAEMLADRLNTAVGVREQAPAIVGDAAETRQRAFALFLTTYAEVRRAIGYLAPDDVDQIAPTLYVPRGPAKKKSEGEPVAAQPAAPVVAPSNGQAVVAPTATKSAGDSPYTA